MQRRAVRYSTASAVAAATIPYPMEQANCTSRFTGRSLAERNFVLIIR